MAERVIAEQVDRLARGCVELFTKQELADRLESARAEGRPLRVKLGMDPTAPDIHLGHSVVLRKLRQFQDMGHKAVLIIGDYTARIGDPSGQDATRPVLDDEQIKANAKTYFAQAGKILDTHGDRLEIRYNSEWLAKLTFAEVLRLGSYKTVAQMLHRESFRQRMDAGSDVLVYEFFYPLMQGYDSVIIESDVELGGTDQTFNNLVGRDLLRSYGKKPQIVMTLPLLVGLDGREKMSKSKGNYVGLTDEPRQMFGKLMSIPDTLMANYYTLLTDVPLEEVKKLTDASRTHPRQAKANLARRVVADYWDAGAAAAASEEFDRIFAKKELPDEMKTRECTASEWAHKLVVKVGFASSNSEAKRKIQQGGVYLNNQRITQLDSPLGIKNNAVLRVGKIHFVRLKVKTG